VVYRAGGVAFALCLRLRHVRAYPQVVAMHSPRADRCSLGEADGDADDCAFVVADADPNTHVIALSQSLYGMRSQDSHLLLIVPLSASSCALGIRGVRVLGCGR
jgi:hypothetical protein